MPSKSPYEFAGVKRFSSTQGLRSKCRYFLPCFGSSITLLDFYWTYSWETTQFNVLTSVSWETSPDRSRVSSMTGAWCGKVGVRGTLSWVWKLVSEFWFLSDGFVKASDQVGQKRGKIFVCLFIYLSGITLKTWDFLTILQRQAKWINQNTMIAVIPLITREK